MPSAEIATTRQARETHVKPFWASLGIQPMELTTTMATNILAVTQSSHLDDSFDACWTGTPYFNPDRIQETR